MRTEVKDFIEKNIELIETNEFEKLYTKVSSDIFGDNVKGEVTQVLWESDIHPEKELINIPRSFAYRCNNVFHIGRDYDHVQTFSNYCFNSASVVTIDLSQSECESIGYAAFQGCMNLQIVKLPPRLKYIEYYAFADCYNLESVNIPSQITQLIDTFYNCKSLTDVTFEGTKQQFKAIKKSNMWRKCSGIKEIICSDGILRFK